MALAPGATEESELTWMDFSWVADIRLSPDGKSYAYVYIRSLYSLYQVTSLK